MHYIGKRDAEDEEGVDAGTRCTWVGPINNYYLHGNDQKTIKDVLASDCMRLCQEETSFDCVSFDYNYLARTCYLSIYGRFTHKLSMSGTYQYYELDCNR